MDTTLVLDTNLTLLETPVWDYRTKRIYCTDLFTGDVHAYDTVTKLDIIYHTGGGMIGSAIPCSDENKLLCALDKGICLFDMRTRELESIADPNCGNEKNRYNDTRVDIMGRIFTSTVSKLYGTSDYTPDMLGDFFMVDTDGSIKTIVNGINQYNCIVWNSDNTEMFVIDTYNQKLLSFDYDIAFGPVSGPKQRLDLSTLGMPDGLSIDSEDSLYICHWEGKISVWDKSLSTVRILEFPVSQVCCGGFGGETLQDFYVATAHYAYTPEQLANRRGAGGLFRMSMKTKGTADHFFQIKKRRISIMNFEFSVPTKIIFGVGEVNRIGEQAALFGKKAMLVTYDEALVKSLGFYEKVEKSCKEAGVELLHHFGVKSNPTAEHAAAGISLAKTEKPDVLIALGGGSAIDEAKFIGVAAKYDGDPWDFPTGKAAITDTIPIIAVVTIPATSSELNGTAVINNETLQRKDGFLSPIMKPHVAILDPELTYTIPMRQTAYSAADIVSHLLEHYLGHQLAFAPYQDHFCEGGIRSIMECMDRLLKSPCDPDARAVMMWQASFAWNGFYDCGFGLPNSNIHILGHSLSNFYDTPHGAAMSITILATLRYYLKQRTAKYARFAREVFGIRENDDMIAAMAGIAAMEAWFKKIGTPVTLAEAGIDDPAAIDKMAPDALLTARAWGEEEEYGYTEDVMRQQYALCQ